MKHDIVIRLLNIDTKIRAFTILDEFGNYNIYINGNLCEEMQRLACEHEVEHIRKGDFYSHKDVAMIEKLIESKG